MTTPAQGMQRLLKLADILDTSDAEHKKRKRPTYDQTMTAHPCGTPACAIGHWAAHNRRRWYYEPGARICLKTRGTDFGYYPSVLEEFALDSSGEATELFGGAGCGDARTGKQAARYIRRFVKRKERELKRAA